MTKTDSHPRRNELEAAIREGRIDTLVVALTDMQGRLMGKRVQGQAFLNGAIDHGAHFCTYLLGTDMEMNTPDGFALMNWETGYGDWIADPVWDTYREVPWLERTAIVLSDTVDHHGHEIPVSPRTILKKVVDRATDLGFRVMAGSEYEYYLLTDTYEQAHAKGYTGLERFGYYNEDYHLLQATKAEPIHGRLRNLMTQAGIPVEFSKGEAAAGQHEVNLHYTDVLEMADQSVLFKHGAKEIAWLNGYGLTFMAKPDHTWTGSSGHLHMSLWDPDGTTALFHDAAGHALRHVDHHAPLPGRDDEVRPRAVRLLGLERELVQAVRGRVLGTGQRGVGPGQPHDRLPDRGRRVRAPHREPLPRRRHEPVPRLRGGRRGRACWASSVRSSRRTSTAATATWPPAATGCRGRSTRPSASWSRARRRSTSSAPMSWPTTSTRPGSSRSSTTRSSIPGIASATSSAADGLTDAP